MSVNDREYERVLLKFLLVRLPFVGICTLIELVFSIPYMVVDDSY